MVHVEFTVQRRHLYVFAGLVLAGVMLFPAMSRASHAFNDVDDDNVFHADIDWLASNGVTKGCNPPTNDQFCPGSAVTREQMAAFMKRLATGGAVDAGAVGGVDASEILDRLDALEAENAALQATLAGVTREGDILTFDGMNLQVVNGEGTTETMNGLGNVIIGYNEDDLATRSGSHYLVIGDEHSYTGYGGAVIGEDHAASGAYASVTGGRRNHATGSHASVTGGYNNHATGGHSAVTGGNANVASGLYASVTGGHSNQATGGHSAVTGGNANVASDLYASVSGGWLNAANGQGSSVSGGNGNSANGAWASVSGGGSSIASAAISAISGGHGNRIFSDATAGSILGGRNGTIEGGDYSVILGRDGTTLDGDDLIRPIF